MINSRKLDDLHPIVAAKAKIFVAKCLEQGIDVLITSTYRDMGSQASIYSQGRTTAGPMCMCGGKQNSIGSCRKHPFGTTVTSARPGQSFHQYRVAFDFVPMVGGKCQWNDTALFTRCGLIAESLGLEWAGRWKNTLESAHCQFTNGLVLNDFLNGKTL